VALLDNIYDRCYNISNKWAAGLRLSPTSYVNLKNNRQLTRLDGYFLFIFNARVATASSTRVY